MYPSHSHAIILLGVLLAVAAPAAAQTIPSPGISGTSITFDGVESGAEWAGAHPFAIDYGGGDPLRADVDAFHDATGIYLLVDIDDASNNNNDALWVRFDLDNSEGAVDANDWGINVLRSGQATWGEMTADPNTWVTVPATNVGTSSSGAGWVVEVKLPVGAPSDLDLSAGTVGAYFAIYDADQAFGANSAKYTQWPEPADLNDVVDEDPDEWGDYEFDPATTFADLAITDLRQGTVPEDYRKISSTGPNEFYIEVENPVTGAVIPDANDVRFNLYLAARGIGEPFHRLDAENVLDSDCNTPPPATLLSPVPLVCDGNDPLPDIGTLNLADASVVTALVGGTAEYTIFEGVTRSGSSADDPTQTVDSGFDDWIHLMDWTLTSSQQPKFAEIIHNGTTYRRQHQCMKAEALFDNDPNPADNTRQRNMDFVCLPGAMARMFMFSLGTAGFAQFQPGKQMLLQATFENISPNSNWGFELEGEQIEQIGERAYAVQFRDKGSIPMQLALQAPFEQALGRPLKEHLVIPPTAGGQILGEEGGQAPVYVRISGGTTLLVANFSFDERDVQFVDLDGRRGMPRNGPEGLGHPYAQEFGRDNLLVPMSAPGALVGSFDNFRTGFEIGPGVQVQAPRGARFLALAINDRRGDFRDNRGTGFRVKVTERKSGGAFGLGRGLGLVPEAHAQRQNDLNLTPITDVMPTMCMHGYEAVEAERELDGTPHELYRHLGRVCWGIINVYDRERSPDDPDDGDPYQEEPGDGPVGGGGGSCGRATTQGLIIAVAMLGVGLLAIRRRVWARARDEDEEA
jgi:hypothetical protein